MNDSEKVLESSIPRVQFFKGSNYLALPRDPQPWIIEKFIPTGGAVNIYAKPKIGKSYLALGIAHAINDPSVDEYLGCRVLKHGPVCYLQIDTPREEWASRIATMRTYAYIDDIHFTDRMMVPFPFDIVNPLIADGLKEALDTIRPVALIVDTLREVHEEDENDSTGMKKVISSLVKATKDINCTLILISHSRKDFQNKFGAGDDNIMDDGRGSSYVPGKMDVICKMTPCHVIMKGRAITERRIAVEQLPEGHPQEGRIILDSEKAENEANIKYVLAQEHLKTKKAQHEMLATMEDIDVETAKSRIRRYKEKHSIKD